MATGRQEIVIVAVFCTLRASSISVFSFGGSMIRKFAVVMVFLLIAGIGNLAAQRPDFAADHYFVGLNSVPTAADLAFLRGQGVQVGKLFSQAQTIEIVTRNPIALAA